MLPSTKPSAPLAVKEIGTRGPNEQWAPVESPPMMAKSNGAEPHRTDWADAKGQLDYFVSAGFNNDSIYRTAITPGGTFVSISPMRSSGRHANADMAKPAGKRTYPSQELNSRYQDLQLSPPRSEGGEKPPPLPPPVLPPWAQAPAGEYCVEKVPSMAPEPSRGHEGKFLPEKVASMAHGQRGNNGGKYHLQEVTSGLTQGFDDLSHNSSGHVLDSFDIDGVGSDSIAAGNLKSEALDGFSRSKHLPAPKRVSTSPSPGSKHSEVSATRLLKRMKGKPKSAAVGIMHPSPLDILRGRGGLTNRHPGNMRFRDEARKMRADYRNRDTTRQEKFVLSQKLAKKVRYYGGRFLEKGADKLWYEMSESDARKKASQVLREEKWV